MKKELFRSKTIRIVTFLALLLMFTVALKSNQVAAEGTGTIDVHVLTTGDSKDQDKRSEYTVDIPAGSEYSIVPMDVKESGILQYFYTDSENNYSVDFYSDAECTESLTYSYSNNFVIIPKAGTYYVKVSNLYADTSVVNSLAISFQLYSDSNPTLKANQWKATGLMDYTKPVYYKFNVTKTG
ncbi:MAG TPA: hypothetical protein VHQ24_00870, partial [Lachnospiraceae bacterium]|nr:hypothetical protein [Lachnospiraceae bacterium]